MVKQIAWNTGSGNITLTYQGQGDAPVTVQSDVNDGAARSQVITIETTKGSPVVTKNFTIKQGACPVPVGTVLNYAYAGSYQEVELPAGKYKLQCWGAQGGSNAAASSYGITAKAGGKGGYSEGVLTLTSKTTVRIYVGGAGSSSAGGFNGGGSTTGSSSYNSNNEQGVSRMGGGGGATDIRLSNGALLSRMIVAGGGSGGAMCYKSVTSTSYNDWGTKILSYASIETGGYRFGSVTKNFGLTLGKTYRFYLSDDNGSVSGTLNVVYRNSSNTYLSQTSNVAQGTDFTPSYSGAHHVDVHTVQPVKEHSVDGAFNNIEIRVEEKVTSTTTSNNSQVGYAGGGTTGDGYSAAYRGKQNEGGVNGGAFGQGANQTVTNYRYCSGAGGGGWYGGGRNCADTTLVSLNMCGGGSGWVNIAANASYRPSGYTGLQLDSGETKAGNTSFPSTSGGTETGHSGNGYARITRLS